MNILQNVFINSFIIESSSEDTPEKINFKIENDNINEKLKFNENIQKTNTNKLKNKFAQILKYKKGLNLSKKVKKFHLFNYECKNPNDALENDKKINLI